MVWMQTMILQDEKEDYEEQLIFTEYLASFSNPEAVKKIREERKMRKTVNDDDFANLVSSISGRDAPNFEGING